MILSNKIRWFGCLLCMFLPALPGASMQQQPRPNEMPTEDLEAQPNTYQYPQAPRHRSRRPQQPVPNPDQGSEANPALNQNSYPNYPPVQQTNQDPAVQTNPPMGAPAIRPMPQMNGVQFPPPSTQNKQPAAATPPAPAPMPQVQPRSNQGFIGPPAPIPPTPEQMPPSAPKIIYQDGLLSVESTNSRLSDILSGIRARTGIQFEGIQTTQDRVAGKFGPAPANEVLTSLFQGSRFDYVIISMPDNPEIVQRVLISPNAAGGATAGSPVTQPVAQQQPSGDEDESEETPAEAQQTPAPQPVQQIQPPPGGRTPEQMVEEMKRNSQNDQNPNPNQMPPAPVKRRPLNPQ